MPGPAVINIRIGKYSQLFNSLDASPFFEKDLDENAVDYIVSWAREYKIKRKIKLLINIPKTKKNIRMQGEVKNSISHYFQYQADLQQKKIKQKVKEGLTILFTGLLFLTLCLLVGEFIIGIKDDFFSSVLAEGLVIMGWVAMWKPISDILYEWLPIKRQKDIYQKLANSEVEIVFE